MKIREEKGHVGFSDWMGKVELHVLPIILYYDDSDSKKWRNDDKEICFFLILEYRNDDMQ